MKIVTVCDLADVPEAVAILEKVGKLVPVGNNRKRLLQELRDCDVYFGGGEIEVDEEFLDHASSLKLIGSPATGQDHLDLNLIKERGIILFHIAEEYELLDSFTAVAEMAFGMIIALVRHLHPSFHDVYQGVWAREKYTGFQLYGKTLGILGLGRLGKMMARIGQGFGMRVIAYERKNIVMAGVKLVDFETLLSKSDILTIHVHLTPENENLIDIKAMGKMKKGAILINTSRGRIVNESDLIRALSCGHLGGAGLDVIDGEWLPQEQLRNHPLIVYARDHDNLLITPHIGGATKESIYGARVFMAKKIAQYIRNI